jgi:hypothetical protein
MTQPVRKWTWRDWFNAVIGACALFAWDQLGAEFHRTDTMAHLVASILWWIIPAGVAISYGDIRAQEADKSKIDS